MHHQLHPLHQLHTAQPAGISGPGLGWLHHVVRPLLRSPGAQRPPAEGCAGGDAVLHHEAHRGTYTGQCFASPQGAGCALSVDELRVGLRVRGDVMSWEG